MGRSPYVTARRLADLSGSLSPRDRDVLTTLRRVRVASGQHLERLHFTDVTRRQTRSVLASLVARRLVSRLPRVVGGVRAGSAGYVYALDVAGLRLLQLGQPRPQRPWSIGQTFLAHSLAVTQLYVELVEADRTGGLRLVEFATEPACWRWFSGPGGGRVALKPDGFAVVRLGGFEDTWFLEVDRATESMPTISRKADAYRQYWQSGTEQAHGGVFPVVLWLVPDARRQAAFVDALGRQPADAWQLFQVALLAEGVQHIARGAVS